MLVEIRQQLGERGLCQVYENCLSTEQREQLLAQYRVKTTPGESSGQTAKGQALALARLTLSAPQAAIELTEVLNKNNQSINETIAAIPDEELFRDLAPQNAEVEIPTGQLIWALFSQRDRPACRKLLSVWIDFLEPLPAILEEGPPESLHQINEDRIQEAERQAVASLQVEILTKASPPPIPLKDLPSEKPEPVDPPEKREEKIESTPAAPTPVTPTPETQSDEPPPSSDPPAVEKERFFDLNRLEKFQNTQNRLQDQLDRMDSRFLQLESLVHSLKNDISTLHTSQQEHYLTKIDGIYDLLGTMQQQSEVIENHLKDLSQAPFDKSEAEPQRSEPREDEPGEKEESEEEKPQKTPLEDIQFSEETSTISYADILTEDDPTAPRQLEESTSEISQDEMDVEEFPEIPLEETEEPATDSSIAMEPEEESETQQVPHNAAPIAEEISDETEQPQSDPPDHEAGEIAQEISNSEDHQDRASASIATPFKEENPLEELASVLENERITIIGGLDSLNCDYRALIEQMGGTYERYFSINEFSDEALVDLTDDAYLVIVLGNMITDPGVYRLMETASRLGRRLFIHHSTAKASLYRFLNRLIDQGEL